MNRLPVAYENNSLFDQKPNLYVGLVSSTAATFGVFTQEFNKPYQYQIIILGQNGKPIKFSVIPQPFPTISLEDFEEKYFSPVEQKLMWENFKKDLWREVVDKKISKIKYYRIIHKLTQTELAKKLNMNQSNISRFEKVGYTPDISTLKKLGTAFSLNYKELL